MGCRSTRLARRAHVRCSATTSGINVFRRDCMLRCFGVVRAKHRIGPKTGDHDSEGAGMGYLAMTGEADFEGAKTYALAELSQKLSARLTYHSVFHTSGEVVPAVERLATRCGIHGADMRQLLTAAWYHDL